MAGAGNREPGNSNAEGDPGDPSLEWGCAPSASSLRLRDLPRCWLSVVGWRMQSGSLVSTSVPFSSFQSLFMFHYLFRPREHELFGVLRARLLGAAARTLAHACRTEFSTPSTEFCCSVNFLLFPLLRRKGFLATGPQLCTLEEGPESSSDTGATRLCPGGAKRTPSRRAWRGALQGDPGIEEDTPCHSPAFRTGPGSATRNRCGTLCPAGHTLRFC